MEESAVESASADKKNRRGRFPSTWRTLARLAGGVGIFLLTLALFGIRFDDLVARFRAMDPRWTAAGMFVVALQMVLSAARWRIIAVKLGGPVSLFKATREYYLSTWLNQILPGGLAGDAFRAARHAASMRSSSAHPTRRALLAVFLDRGSGQLALWTIIALGAPWSLRFVAPRAMWLGSVVAVLILAVALVLLVGRVKRWRGSAALSTRRALWIEAKDAFLSPRILVAHFGLSVLVVASYVALFDVSARALRHPLSFAAELWVVPLILAASTAPIVFSGWGVREAASAALYHAAGLDPALGAAVGLAYGLLTLAGSAPGLAVLLLSKDLTASGEVRDDRGIRAGWHVWHAAALMLAVAGCVLFSTAWPLAIVAVPSFAILLTLSRGSWTNARRFGAANMVTAQRLVLLVALATAGDRIPLRWTALVLLVVLALDGVDGWLARYFGTSSPFGARFDTEVDAFLVLIGCVSLFVLKGFGPWVLIGGLLRYATVLLMAFKPPAGGEPSRSRLGRRAFVLAVAAIAAAHWFHGYTAIGAAVVSTAALAYSFAVSVTRAYLAPRPSRGRPSQA